MWIGKSKLRVASLYRNCPLTVPFSSFNMDMDPVETIPMYIESCVQGGRQYLMKESPDSLPRARRQLML